MFHWYFTKPFSELSCHFLSKSKGGILDELRVSFKVSSRGEVSKCLFFFFYPEMKFHPSLFDRGGIHTGMEFHLGKNVKTVRDISPYTGKISSQDEISRVNTLLYGIV